jgi:hypothetical protein
VCEYTGFPGYKWGSNTDDTGLFGGVTCSPLERPLPGSSLQNLSDWWKVARLIAEL